jgi:hypothetical protein
MKKRMILGAVVSLLLLLVFGNFVGTFVHELGGHGLTAILLGGKVTSICVLFVDVDSSGLHFVPCIVKYGINFAFGRANYDFEHITPLQYGYITMMGSLITLLVSIIFSFVLLYKDVKGYKKIIFSIFAIYFLDMLNMFASFFAGRHNDFWNILNSLNISLVPLLPIVLFSVFTTMTILYYKWKDKKISKELKIVLTFVLSLVVVSLAIFLVWFGFEIYRLWAV